MKVLKCNHKNGKNVQTKKKLLTKMCLRNSFAETVTESFSFFCKKTSTWTIFFLPFSSMNVSKPMHDDTDILVSNKMYFQSKDRARNAHGERIKCFLFSLQIVVFTSHTILFFKLCLWNAAKMDNILLPLKIVRVCRERYEEKERKDHGNQTGNTFIQ